ncbi:MAG: acyl-CoA/acyl-ACP dehydrogenase [Mycobacterium sp.]|nr:acyl-CoA/acyl-ACP dehydrogenase [Mycobacterium sp.]
MSDDMLDDLRATTRRALAADGADILDELGLAGLLVDYDRGGLGLGEREMTLVATELGRALSFSGFLATAVLGVTLLSDSDTAEAAGLLEELGSGQSRCAVASSSWMPSAPTVIGQLVDGHWAVSGSTLGLFTPSEPDTVLVAAATPAGTQLFSVAREYVSVTAADLLDPARGMAQLEFAAAAARLLAGPEQTEVATRRAYHRGLVAVAAEQLGIARMCLEMSVEYAKSRTQFGSPIGSFQAVKHRCAEVLLDVELGDAVLAEAVVGRSVVDDELAFIVATRAALAASDACIQIHGGIGFTWEHKAHWYFRRARVNATLMGPPSVHRAAIAGSLDLV